MYLFWKMVKWGLKVLLGMIVLMACFICSIPMYYVNSSNSSFLKTNTAHISNLLFKDNIDFIRMTQGYHNEENPGFEGYDYTTFCGDMLYSPLPGTGVITYNGFDGLYNDNTMLVIEGYSGKVTLLHGNYTADVGDIVIGGITPIGINASRGYSTGCHAHITWKPSLNYVSIPQQNYPLAISEYDPLRGGINCDSDCTTMASGDKVAEWMLGKNGVYASACPAEWDFGQKFTIQGNIYECRDRGSYINCYSPGEYDPAYKTIVTEHYCWVDILGDTGFNYGDMTLDWSFIR